jgi:hypothetical protein
MLYSGGLWLNWQYLMNWKFPVGEQTKPQTKWKRQQSVLFGYVEPSPNWILVTVTGYSHIHYHFISNIWTCFRKEEWTRRSVQVTCLTEFWWLWLGFCAMYWDKNWPTFQRCLLPDDGGRKNLWNVSQFLPDYTAQLSKRHSSSHLSPWEPKISLSPSK